MNERMAFGMVAIFCGILTVLVFWSGDGDSRPAS